MNTAELLTLRLASQRLIGAKSDDIVDTVAWLGAVQSQDFVAAKWALGIRSAGLTASLVGKSYDNGEILRTHLLRPTWHIVAPGDIQWMLSLTASRVNAATAYYYREFGLDDAFFIKSNAVIANAVSGGNHKTRKELAAILDAHGMGGSPQQLGLIVMRAELDGVICSGPMRGKQCTYASFLERTPPGSSLSARETGALLAERYFMSHGPATLKDFIWWSGLRAKDAAMCLDAIDSKLTREVVNDESFWFDKNLTAHIASIQDMASRVLLLHNYDEYVVAYIDRTMLIDPRYVVRLGARANLLFYNCIVFQGRVVGIWKRILGVREVVVSWLLFEPSPVQIQALHEALRDYEAFIGMPVRAEKVERL